MTIGNTTEGCLYSFVCENLYRAEFADAADASTNAEILSYTEDLAKRAFTLKDSSAALEVQRSAYKLLTSNFALPWELDAVNIKHPLFQSILYIIEREWGAADRELHADTLAASNLPSTADFPQWIEELVQIHDSNVSHPIFSFLKDEASFSALREFLLQETPFDIFFGDLITLMMPGIYGAMKVELLGNFWDEMGHAQEHRMHRQLRIEMMKSIDIDPAMHLNNIEYFCLSELELVNLYLFAAFNRARLPELIGMMLATETMVPGRLEHQIEGWRRTGLKDEQMPYLIEHTVVDVEHAHGWMENVVKPLLTQSPRMMDDIVFGVLRRLDKAGAVCDEMLPRLRALS